MADVTARLQAIRTLEHMDAVRLVHSTAEWQQTLAPGGRQSYFVEERTWAHNEDEATERLIQLRILGRSWSDIAKRMGTTTRAVKQVWKHQCEHTARLLPSKPQLRWSYEGTSWVLRNKGYQVARVYRLPGLVNRGFQFRTSDNMIGVHQEERTARDVAKWLVLQMLTTRQGKRVER